MSDAPQAPVTALLAEHCRGMRFETLPGEVIFSARQCLLDWLGVGDVTVPVGGSKVKLTVNIQGEYVPPA